MEGGGRESLISGLKRSPAVPDLLNRRRMICIGGGDMAGGRMGFQKKKNGIREKKGEGKLPGGGLKTRTRALCRQLLRNPEGSKKKGDRKTGKKGKPHYDGKKEKRIIQYSSERERSSHSFCGRTENDAPNQVLAQGEGGREGAGELKEPEERDATRQKHSTTATVKALTEMNAGRSRRGKAVKKSPKGTEKKNKNSR